MEQTQSRYDTIVLQDGREVIDLTPSLEGNLAIVHLSVIKRLARVLPQANLQDLKARTYDLIETSQSIEAFFAVLEDEVAFHHTVNLIERFKIK